MAQIQLYQGNFKQAQQSLEVGLSYNFEVIEISSVFEDFTFCLLTSFCITSVSSNVKCVWQVREQPTYHLVRARVMKKQGQYQEAINTLKACLNMTNTRPTSE